MNRPALAADEVVWSPRGERVLGPVSLTVPHGEITVVIGPNGAGKTTLLRLLAGILTPSEGAVRLDDRRLSAFGRRQLARRIAHLPQRLASDAALTVADHVALGRFPHRSRLQLAADEADRRAVEHALARLGLSDRSHRLLSTLSGGERQLALLATALVQEADVWLLDEPTTHLDPRYRRRIARLLGELGDEEKTLVVATHDLDLAAHLSRGPLAAQVLALRDGRIAADGPAAEVLSATGLEQIFDAPFEVAADGAGIRVLL